jgi:hypothetical protein
VFSEILKIKPQLDNSDLNKMERTLGQRFAKIAKKFGGGIMSVIKGGGAVSVVLGLLDKLLNPLQAVQETIEKVLNTSDDIATNAEQFDTTVNKLSKLVFIGRGAGLQDSDLYQLLNKFQGSLAKAKTDKNSPDYMALKNYTNEKDVASAFFEFIQELKKMDKTQQRLVQETVFGEKQVLKMSEFLNKDFGKYLKESGIGGISSKRLGGAVTKAADLNDVLQGVRAANEAKNLIAASAKINNGTVQAIAEREQSQAKLVQDQIDAFQNLANISNTVDEIFGVINKLLEGIGVLIGIIRPFVQDAAEFFKRILASPFVKGLLGKERK